MSELLTRPTILTEPRPLGAPEPSLDAFTQARVEEAAAAAYERGMTDGAAGARAEITAASARITAALQSACTSVTAELQGLRAAQATADVELALAIAETILGQEPSQGAGVLLERVRAALSRLDDPGLTVHIHPADAGTVAEALRTEAAVTVTHDSALAPGEARITGQWARAELTRDAAWETVRTVLGVQP